MIKMKQKIQIGLFSFVVSLAFYFSIQFLKGISFFSTQKYIYYILYDRIENLKISNPVVLNGLEIGLVRDIKFLPNKNYKIQVTCAIDKNIALTEKSVATIVSHDLLGSKAIDIKLEQQGKKLDNKKFLIGKVEGNIQDNLKNSFLPLIEELKSTSVALHEFISTIAKSQQKINETINNIEAITYNFKNLTLNSQEKIDRMIGKFSEITNFISCKNTGILPIFSKANTLIENINNANFGNSIKKFDQLLNELQIALSPNNTTGTLSMLLHNKKLYTDTNHTLKNLNQLFIDIKNNPNRYIHFSIFGQKKTKNNWQ